MFPFFPNKTFIWLWGWLIDVFLHIFQGRFILKHDAGQKYLKEKCNWWIFLWYFYDIFMIFLWYFYDIFMIFVWYIKERFISEILRVQNGGRPPGRENRLLDVYNEKPVRVSARILVPVKEHPRVSHAHYHSQEYLVIYRGFHEKGTLSYLGAQG